jgi:hypothetical protein
LHDAANMREEALMKATFVVLVIAVAILVGLSAVGASESDREAVRQAALDYVDGIYDVKPDRIQRSVHPSLVKRGFYRKDASTPYVEMPMTYEQLVNLAGSWNKGGTRDTSIKTVEVLEVLDQTAVAKVTAAWGIDYMLLGKYDGAWKISQILWQSHPGQR